MKDIKSYVIGFLTCACMFLIMGQTGNRENGYFNYGYFETVYTKSIITDDLGLMISDSSITIMGDNGKMTIISAGGITVSNGQGVHSIIVPEGITVMDEISEFKTLLSNKGLYNSYQDKFSATLTTGDRGSGELQIWNPHQTSLLALGVGKINGGFLRLTGINGKHSLLLSAEENGGSIWTFSSNGTPSIYAGTNKDGFGIIKTFHKENDVIMNQLTEGIVSTYNNQSVMTGYFGTSNKNDGIVALKDRYGEIGWIQSAQK